MKIAYSKIIILTSITQFFVMPSSLAQNISQDEEKLLPRTFCQNTKGNVSETGTRHILYVVIHKRKNASLTMN